MPALLPVVKKIWGDQENLAESEGQTFDRSQIGFGFVFMVSDSDSQFRIRKTNTKLENLKVIFWCFKEN